MNRFNISPDDDSSSTNSNEYNYTENASTKKVPINSQYVDIDAESQNFLPSLYYGKKKFEEEYRPGNTSFGISAFNLSNAIMGSGILGLAYAMANTGIVLFVILLSAVSIFSLYSVHLLLKTSKEGGSLLYEQLGQRAFGMPGKVAASVSITMQNFGAMSSYLYIVKYELPLVILAFLNLTENTGHWYLNGDWLVIIVSIVLILPLSLLKNLGNYLCQDMLVESTVLNAELCSKIITVYAVPILTFAFVCHPAVLPIYEELKDRSRKKMQRVANVSFLGIFVMYLLAAVFGYLTFYGHVEPELLHTYSKVYKFDTVLLVVRLAVLMAVTLTVPVVLFPIRTSVQQLLFPSKEFNWVRHSLITVIILGLANCLVIFVPTIRDIFGFMGASAAAMLIFILPSAFYIKLVKKESMKSVQKIGALIFLICGIFVMISSMTLIILDWIHNASTSEGH
uniref:Sodium-coupled neutral amino acid symporter 2 n=1 Tax=Callorhinchus milii TaxID=7868 RepID=A0A4W3K3S2_CALMI